MHESESDTTQLANEKKSVSIWLYLAGTIAVAAYVSFLVPAFYAQSPNPKMGYAVMFWSGLFFHLLWKHRNRSGRNGAIIGALVGLLVFVAAAFISGVARSMAGH